MPRLRLDNLLVERGLAVSETDARALLMAGHVFAGEQRLDKPGTMVRDDLALALRGQRDAWVSRGAHKLLAGLDAFGIEPDGAVALDVGASTGGFTHVLLDRGAARVYAVDVGRGLLDWSLRNDPRVVLREGTNARRLTAAEIPEPVDLVVCDASFIALQTVLPAALTLARPGAGLIALIKPQFEAAAREVERGGVVRDPAVHARVCAEAVAWLETRAGWRALGVVPSPIRGPAGNVEFLLGGRLNGPAPQDAAAKR